MLPRVFLESVGPRELTELCLFYAMRDAEADRAAADTPGRGAR